MSSAPGISLKMLSTFVGGVVGGFGYMAFAMWKNRTQINYNSTKLSSNHPQTPLPSSLKLTTMDPSLNELLTRSNATQTLNARTITLIADRVEQLSQQIETLTSTLSAFHGDNERLIRSLLLASSSEVRDDSHAIDAQDADTVVPPAPGVQVSSDDGGGDDELDEPSYENYVNYINFVKASIAQATTCMNQIQKTFPNVQDLTPAGVEERARQIEASRARLVSELQSGGDYHNMPQLYCDVFSINAADRYTEALYCVFLRDYVTQKHNFLQLTQKHKKLLAERKAAYDKQDQDTCVNLDLEIEQVTSQERDAETKLVVTFENFNNLTIKEHHVAPKWFSPTLMYFEDSV